jgi:hypothetical protein
MKAATRKQATWSVFEATDSGRSRAALNSSGSPTFSHTSVPASAAARMAATGVGAAVENTSFLTFVLTLAVFWACQAFRERSTCGPVKVEKDL